MNIFRRLCRKVESLALMGRVINDQMGAGLQEALEDKHVTISYEEDLVGEIWENRPALSAEPVWILEKNMQESLQPRRSKTFVER